MPRLLEATKDATSGDNAAGECAHDLMIRRYPNETTQHIEDMSPYIKEQTRGTETSKYPEEKKTIVIPHSSGERTRKSPNQYEFRQ